MHKHVGKNLPHLKIGIHKKPKTQIIVQARRYKHRTYVNRNVEYDNIFDDWCQVVEHVLVKF